MVVTCAARPTAGLIATQWFDATSAYHLPADVLLLTTQIYGTCFHVP